MDQIPELLANASKLLATADHLAFVTYPMVKEPKLAFTISEHLYNACVNAMDALLYYEYRYKRLDILPDKFTTKVIIFKQQIGPRYNIDRSQILAIEDMHNLLEDRKKSQVEFRKHDKMVMFHPDYEIKTLTMEKVKSYVYEAKSFLEKINSLLKVQNVRRH